MSARILLVEDNEELAAGIRHNLELEGYHVSWAGDGMSGLEAARAEPPDLLILDIMLPELDGFDVLHTLRQEGFVRPVLLLTAGRRSGQGAWIPSRRRSIRDEALRPARALGANPLHPTQVGRARGRRG
jgi:CheY-like chemotaxis protein